MIRKDGRFTIYMIETRSPNYRSGEWFKASMDHYYRSKYENGCMLASAPCWQETNVTGTYDKLRAIDLCAKIQADHPKEDFRVVEVKIEMLTTSVCEFPGKA